MLPQLGDILDWLPLSFDNPQASTSDEAAIQHHYNGVALTVWAVIELRQSKQFMRLIPVLPAPEPTGSGRGRRSRPKQPEWTWPTIVQASPRDYVALGVYCIDLPVALLTAAPPPIGKILCGLATLQGWLNARIRDTKKDKTEAMAG